MVGGYWNIVRVRRVSGQLHGHTRDELLWLEDIRTCMEERAGDEAMVLIMPWLMR